MSKTLKSLRTAALAGASLGLFAACGSVSSVSSIDNHHVDFELYRAAASDGTVHVAVYGNVGSLSRNQLNTIVADQFEIAHIGPEATYSTDPASVDYDNTRFVVAFNPGPGVNVTNICTVAADDATTAKPESPMRAIGAFCRGATEKTWTRSTVRDGGETVDIADLVKSVAHEVIPRPTRDTRCDTTPCL